MRPLALLSRAHHRRNVLQCGSNLGIDRVFALTLDTWVPQKMEWPGTENIC